MENMAGPVFDQSDCDCASRDIGCNDMGRGYKRSSERSYIKVSAHSITYKSLFILLMLIPYADSMSTLFYPPFFNAALRKPVVSHPENVTCGESQRDFYCRSSSNEQSTKACFEETCSAVCPHGNSFPGHDKVSRLVSQDYIWGNCVMAESSFLAPTSGSVTGLRWAGTGAGCAIPLQGEWLAPIVFLKPYWDTTFTLWIYNNLGNNHGTLLDAFTDDTSEDSVLRVSLNQDQLIITSGADDISEPSWSIPQDTWTHLAIQLFNRSLSVFINGKYIAPTHHAVNFRSNNNAHTWWIGKSHQEYDPFVGYLQDFRIYQDLLVNRGIESVYNNGTMKETRIYSSCLCPAGFPLLKESDPTFCIQNPGDGRSPTEMYRLNRNSYALDFVNDGKDDNSFMTPSPQNLIAVEIDLGDIFEVHHVDILLYSPVPDLLTIERRVNASAPWSVWQYYALDCRTVGRDKNEPLVSEDDVNCLDIIRFDEQYIYSGARIKFDLLAGRPGKLNHTMTPALRKFLMAGAVKVTLSGHPFIIDDRHLYHAISEVKVNATCDCNGRGTDCSLDRIPYECHCAPASNSFGRQCDACMGDTYFDGVTETCNLCDCHINGTQPSNETCMATGGQCDCKEHAAGRSCDACALGYFNLTHDNPAGCVQCNCDTNGTVAGSDECDMYTGQCQCKEYVTGVKCDRCKPGHTTLSADNPAGCLGCECNEHGSIPGDACITETATCRCRDYATGRNCDRCVDGTYNLTRAHVEGCQPCLCATDFGAINASCDILSGQCHCLPGVSGMKCKTCISGKFARNMTDLRNNGCSLECDCNQLGSTASVCEEIGGQCPCKGGVLGRKCDKCAPGTYLFGAGPSVDQPCLPCDCDVTGTVNASTVCDDVTGQCACASNVIGRRCDTCKDGFYGPLSGLDGCKACDCAERGTVINSQCNVETGQCVCIPEDGDVTKGGRTCGAYIAEMVPGYGPESGGTDITLVTGYLGDISTLSVLLGTQQCDVNVSSSDVTSVNCTSRPVTAQQGMVLYKDQTVAFLWLNDGTKINSSFKFIYMDDPVIDDIKPLNTFVSGGLELTVTGQYLNSVMFPKMTVTMVYKPKKGTTSTTQTFSSGCSVVSTDVMLCPTPSLDIPKSFIGRQKRSLHETRSLSGKRKRQADNDGSLNDEELTFYLGFILDGVERYKNMSMVNPDLGIIRVYRSPEFEMFSDKENIKIFRKYWPVNDNHILIQGKNLRYGCTQNCYTIHIADKFCTNVTIYDSFISCVPPESQPSTADGSSEVVITVGNIEFLVGYVKYQTSIWFYPPFRYGIIASICIVVIIVVVIIVCCVVCRRKANKASSTSTVGSYLSSKSTKSTKVSKSRAMSFISAYDTKDDIEPYMVVTGFDMLSILPSELRVSIVDLLIDKKHIDVGRVIGEGHFGQVHVGIYKPNEISKPETVAIKTLKENRQKSRQDTIQFLEEATIMKDFQHSNVLSVYGVVLEEHNVQVVLPYMDNGDLKNFISKENNMLTVGELIHFGMQISSGMAYLCEQRFVHRDLACRNCMVSKDLIVKVADFGLSRDIYQQDYYRVGDKKRALPVKWMAIESLDDGVWTTKSDVWSYGVVMWELLTRGCPPYPNVDAFDIKAYLLHGNRMERPDYAPDEIYSLMLLCWQADPVKRPTFKQIRDRMSYFLNEVSTQTFMRDKQGQQVPSMVTRGHHSYLQIIG